jgi:hypothetical protein
MTRKIIPVSHFPPPTHIFTPGGLRQPGRALNQRNQETFSTPFPKHSSRWVSRCPFHPRPITFTDKRGVEDRLNMWLRSPASCLGEGSGVFAFSRMHANSSST